MKGPARKALGWAAKKGAANAGKKLRAGARRVKAAAEHLAGVKENPGYIDSGASFDLVGGESRRLPKKVQEFSRPRVKIRGTTVTFAKHSPFKGRIERANPGPSVVVAPLRVELSADEVRQLDPANNWPPASLVRKILAGANKRRGWDHVEAVDAKGRHLFDLVP